MRLRSGDLAHAALLEVVEGLEQLAAGVHDERTLPGDRLADRRAAQHDHVELGCAALGRVLVGALVQVPAAWVLTGIVMVLFGTMPRLAALSWAVLAAFMLLGDLGPLLGLDQWLLDISPFAHVPHMPGGAISATPLLWLIFATAILTATGLTTLRRRDIG